MARVALSPEGFSSLKRLPREARDEFSRLLSRMEEFERLRLPGQFIAHRLEGGSSLWTLTVGAYRGIFRWDGHDARFIRFGHRSSVYQRLPN
jgi:mRNA-degrading endonuclease RelE of RelBE toxin-antitoxin system